MKRQLCVRDLSIDPPRARASTLSHGWTPASSWRQHDRVMPLSSGRIAMDRSRNAKLPLHECCSDPLMAARGIGAPLPLRELRGACAALRFPSPASALGDNGNRRRRIGLGEPSRRTGCAKADPAGRRVAFALIQREPSPMK